MGVWVKICGITRPEDALAAVEAGADAVGFVFAQSPRRVEAPLVREIVSRLPDAVEKVGVFVDAPLEELIRTAAAAGLTAVQLHGSETPEYVEAIEGMRVIKALRVASREDIDAAGRYRGISILLDTASRRRLGGTGETFDWSLAAPLAAERSVILAGGLRPANVAEALRAVRPAGVDVSSGVESAPGIKNREKVREFVRIVRAGARME